MDEASGPGTEIEDLREAYLFVNDPFHARFLAAGFVALMAMWAGTEALFSDPGESGPEVPAGLLLLMGFGSAWARWNAGRADAAGFRRSLRRSHAVMRWTLPFVRVASLVVPALYALLVWKRWEGWKSILQEMGTTPGDMGGWGNLLFERSDLTFLPIVATLVWLGLLAGPRILAASAPFRA